MTILEHGKSNLLYCEGYSTALIVSCLFGQLDPTPNCQNNGYFLIIINNYYYYKFLYIILFFLYIYKYFN